MDPSRSVNIFKYTDYGNPIIYHKSDYRTANAFAHRFCVSVDKNFVPKKSHTLCRELKAGWGDYRPKSESAKQFGWKINSKRSHREELAPLSSSVRCIHNFTDKLKMSAPMIPLKSSSSRFKETSLPREPNLTIVSRPKIEYVSRETHFTDTGGYFPHADQLISATQLDFHPHPNYSTARTNLIVRKELPFNSDIAFMIPVSKLINENPFRKKHCNENMKDNAKFVPLSFDRIIPNRSLFVPNFGFTTEMSSSY